MATTSVACAPLSKPPVKRCPDPRSLFEAERSALQPEPLVASGNSLPWHRTCDDLPNLIGIIKRGSSTQMALFTICVHPEGFVYDLTMERSTGVDEADRVLWEALRKWRYEPIVRDGTAIPFCHGQRIQYTQH